MWALSGVIVSVFFHTVVFMGIAKKLQTVGKCFVNSRKENTVKKSFALGALIAFAATSAFAQATVPSEFYVVRDATTKKCFILDQKPITSTITVVDNGTFKTRTEAETGMKTMKVCTETN